jgi:hypothetical protein
MELFGLFLVVTSLLLLVLLAMLVIESALKLRLAWRFRKVVENACVYPECITRQRPDAPE